MRKSSRRRNTERKTAADLYPPGFTPPQLPAEQASFLESMGVKLIPEPEFHELAAIIADNFGIKVTPTKLTLVTGRIHPIMLRHNFRDYRQFIDALKADKTGDLVSELANHVSTNHTAFYREDAHFKYLNSVVLPELAADKRRVMDNDLRIWCAACSTGEEAYTLQFCLLRFFGREYGQWRAGVLATDISARALAKAKAGVYPGQRMESVPLDVQLDYFRKVDPEHYEIDPKVRSEVTFRRLNLMNRAYPLKKPFDIIFCRNVMIYFDQSERIALVDRLTEWVTPSGYLFIGHSESVPGLDKNYLCVAPSVYKRRKG